jgi:hypothetical protein
MKKLIISFILCLGLAKPMVAQVDSIHWDNLSMPHTFYLKIQLGQGNQLKHIDQFFISDTLFLDFIFSDCAAPTQGYYYDSLVSLPNSVTTPSYNFMVRYAFDSNTIVGNNCYVHPRWYDTIFQYTIPVGLHDWRYQASQALNLWPNPTNDIVHIEAVKGDLPSEINVYNLQGQLIKTLAKKPNTQKQEIDLSGLKAGVYLLKTNTGIFRIQKE